MASQGSGNLFRRTSKAVSSSSSAKATPNAVPRTYFIKTFKFGSDVPDPEKKGFTGYYLKNFRYGNATQSGGDRIGPRRTVFTSPAASKSSVLDLVRNSPLGRISEDLGEDNAVVILASPRHASWLTDPDFMASLVSSLLAHRNRDHEMSRFHVLAAVVDGLCPRSSPLYHEMQEGLSIQFGSLDTLLPGLWNDTTDATQHVQGSAEPSYLSVSVEGKGLPATRISISLPLANTLFHNGRRTTLLVSEWKTEGRGDSSSAASVQLLRMAEKRSQTIDLPGARLHKILSGGGAWGAKAKLLSLDPQTSYGQESEEDELLRFQRSFYGSEEGGDAIAKPGDFVQFFVCSDMRPIHTLGESEGHTRTPAAYPPVIFGVGDLSQTGATSRKDSAPAERQLAWLAPGHFGGFSAEGLYVDSPTNSMKTKLDAPGTSVSLPQVSEPRAAARLNSA
ncbi:hypothetical protein M406DRAFT_332816 [Cryphonectria parasitica EP155]|uniref:Uncharacterized protein n=1 Tax=Cryphonectria parasitica (strain ATCC 38755 / EP155) TaxID=660469 RepID=A0A9P4XXL9_CRYP1|nr:uncharacterized protein M406DRAFT_332816 [Cryphonectria parasitica EP155]KAF3762435.1 hypothetical protein M406DRAFT_332816 [Cryphonectria parasitica EP155]